MDSIQHNESSTAATGPGNSSSLTQDKNTHHGLSDDNDFTFPNYDESSSSAGHTEESEHRIATFIIKELSLKLQYGHSVSEFEHDLRNDADLLGGHFLTKWETVVQTWHTNPKHYKVCVGTNHSILLDERAECCPVCLKRRSSCLDYYVFGLHFQDWFCTEERCRQLMSHWQDKDEWLNVSCTPTKATELWHGERCYRTFGIHL